MRGLGDDTTLVAIGLEGGKENVMGGRGKRHSFFFKAHFFCGRARSCSRRRGTEGGGGGAHMLPKFLLGRDNVIFC